MNKAGVKPDSSSEKRIKLLDVFNASIRTTFRYFELIMNGIVPHLYYFSSMCQQYHTLARDKNLQMILDKTRQMKIAESKLLVTTHACNCSVTGLIQAGDFCTSFFTYFTNYLLLHTLFT